jgi:phosphoserine phosphatase
MTLSDHPALRRLLEQSHAGDPGVRPLAVFDCDGTVIQGDIGESVFFRQIEEFFFRVSPADLWPDHPHRAALDAVYRTLAALDPGARISHPGFPEFAEHLLSFYYDQLAADAVHKGCADIVRLFAGFTVAEVQAFSRDTLQRELHVPLGEKALGRRKVHSGARFLGEAKELIQILLKNGFDIWAVSGSSKWSVEPVFTAFGIPEDQVIGISLAHHNGTLSDIPIEPIPIRAEKVGALQALETRIPLLVASDSRNDIPLLLYATTTRVWINSRHRSAADFFAAVGAPPDERWVIIHEPTILHTN